MQTKTFLGKIKLVPEKKEMLRPLENIWLKTNIFMLDNACRNVDCLGGQPLS